MNISYINLGVRFDKDKGEIVPNLPKNGTHLQVIDFKSMEEPVQARSECPKRNQRYDISVCI